MTETTGRPLTIPGHTLQSPSTLEERQKGLKRRGGKEEVLRGRGAHPSTPSHEGVLLFGPFFSRRQEASGRFLGIRAHQERSSRELHAARRRRHHHSAARSFIPPVDVSFHCEERSCVSGAEGTEGSAWVWALQTPAETRRPWSRCPASWSSSLLGPTPRRPAEMDESREPHSETMMRRRTQHRELRQ